jgi:hypothetical protein
MRTLGWMNVWPMMKALGARREAAAAAAATNLTADREGPKPGPADARRAAAARVAGNAYDALLEKSMTAAEAATGTRARQPRSAHSRRRPRRAEHTQAAARTIHPPSSADQAPRPEACRFV